MAATISDLLLMIINNSTGQVLTAAERMRPSASSNSDALTDAFLSQSTHRDLSQTHHPMTNELIGIGIGSTTISIEPGCKSSS